MGENRLRVSGSAAPSKILSSNLANELLVFSCGSSLRFRIGAKEYRRKFALATFIRHQQKDSRRRLKDWIYSATLVAVVLVDLDDVNFWAKKNDGIKKKSFDKIW
eukprot:GHVP01069923.1.p1 GENE.GHVP01069923.1~~GHVP01069923.1.p1  ORF type:complete len:105 (+),score=8.09 GHVP01069923.1:451-765(+)